MKNSKLGKIEKIISTFCKLSSEANESPDNCLSLSKNQYQPLKPENKVQYSYTTNINSKILKNQSQIISKKRYRMINEKMPKINDNIKNVKELFVPPPNSRSVSIEAKRSSKEQFDTIIENNSIPRTISSKMSFSSKPRAYFFRERPNTKLEVKTFNGSSSSKEYKTSILKRFETINTICSGKEKSIVSPVKGLHKLKSFLGDSFKQKITKDPKQNSNNNIFKQRIRQELLLDNFMSKSTNEEGMKKRNEKIDFRLSKWIYSTSNTLTFKKDLRPKIKDKISCHNMVVKSQIDSHDTTA